jgi:hypothetical protein
MDFKAHFNAKFPEEAVGYLKGGVFHPLDNIADDPLNSFKCDPSFLIEEPDALLHSHPVRPEVADYDPRSPSRSDLHGQIITAIEWGVCVTDGQTCSDPLWWGNPDHRPPLLERDFIFNIQDCLSLAQDWFYQERGIVLPNHPRTPHWYSEGANHIEDLYASWGFKPIDLSDLQHGDVLLYKFHCKVINHIGIYLGNNEVLSHWFGQVSCIEPYGKRAKYIQLAGRYQP